MKINALVEVLARERPELLAALREREPALQAWLGQGLTMGASGGGGSADALDPAIEEKLGKVAGSALSATSERAEALARRLFARMAWVRRLGLAANILAALGSAGVIAVLASSRSAPLAIAFATFVATAVTGWSQYLEGFGGSKGGLGEGANRLAEIAVKAERCLRELELRLITSDGARGLPAIIQDANQLAADLRLIDLSMGGR
jgi:hypothetical protein